MNRAPHRPSRIKRRIIRLAWLLAYLLIQSFPAIVFADKLVLISPHWEGIRYEFERAFKAHYQRDTGRTVGLEWMDVGGSSETLRYLESGKINKIKGSGVIFSPRSLSEKDLRSG